MSDAASLVLPPHKDSKNPGCLFYFSVSCHDSVAQQRVGVGVWTQCGNQIFCHRKRTPLCEAGPANVNIFFATFMKTHTGTYLQMYSVFVASADVFVETDHSWPGF